MSELRKKIQEASARFANELCDALESVVAKDTDYLNQNTAPIRKRKFLALAKAGAFPSRKEGQLVLVRREDFERWLAKHARLTPAQQGEKDPELAAAERLGLAPVKRVG